MKPIIVTGTDTGVGKTIFSAMLTLALKGSYYKPIQSGTEEETDTEIVKRITKLGDEFFIAEQYKFKTPVSPHLAAELDHAKIDINLLRLPTVANQLIVEGAGGLLVPLTRSKLNVDVFSLWRAPIVLCARTTLGTINHTLLSIDAIKKYSLPLLGVAFIGEENCETESIILEFSGAKRLGRLPWLNDINPITLMNNFNAHFNHEDFKL